MAKRAKYMDERRFTEYNFCSDATEFCASSTGTLSLSRCQLFESEFRPEFLHLNDPNCKGTIEDGRVLFHFDNELHICGTTLSVMLG